MSQFDYPRINFFGRATVSPCTAKNVNDTPWIYCDPVQVAAVLPPRVFLRGAAFLPPYTLQDVEAPLPPGALQRDGETLNLSIDPVKDKAAFDVDLRGRRLLRPVQFNLNRSTSSSVSGFNTSTSTDSPST